MKQKITDYLDEIYGGTFTATHLQKLVTRLESAKRLITQRRKKHWDERCRVNYLCKSISAMI